MNSMNARVLTMLFSALLLTGCATTSFKGRIDLIDFLADGKTTKEESIVQLGQPSGEFENEKILTYRLGVDPHNLGFYIVERAPGVGAEPSWATWINTKYSLVLVFNEQNILTKHSLVEVMR